MATTSSLQTLIELAQKNGDASAKKLGKLNSQKQDAEKKLHLLLQYRDSYQARFQDSAKNGIDHIEWLNFVAFMNKLDAAITEQKQNVIQAQNNREIGNEEYLSSQRKLKSYDTLFQRHQITEQQKQTKREQKLQDEYTTNTHRYKKNNSEDY